MTYGRETSNVKRETSLEETVAREALLVKRRLRTTRYERRLTSHAYQLKSL